MREPRSQARFNLQAASGWGWRPRADSLQSEQSGQIEAAIRAWQIREAKAHPSGSVRETEHTGPQAIVWHGRGLAVVLSKAEYERLTRAGQSLVEFMRRSPLFGADDIDLARDASPTRDVAL